MPGPSAVENMDPAALRSLALSLPTIEQAKGVLMGYYGCDATAAFAILRRWSSTRNVKVRDLAAELVDHAGRSPAREAARPHERRGVADTGTPAGRMPAVPAYQGLRAYLEAIGVP